MKGVSLLVTENIQDSVYEVEFLNCVTDKADGFRIVEADSHFAAFVGIHPSKIRQGKIFLTDVIEPADRQYVFDRLCKKSSKYIYIDFNIIKKSGERVFIHCTAQNLEDSKLCRLVFADVSKSREKARELREKARQANYLIDLVTGGVCLFKVTPEMHFDVLYMNDACCRSF